MRTAGRLVVLALIFTFTIYEALNMRREFQLWQEAKRIGDTSAADLYRTNFCLDGVEGLTAWAIAAAILFIFRSKRSVE
jgi:hypothetical protein